MGGVTESFVDNISCTCSGDRTWVWKSLHNAFPFTLKWYWVGICSVYVNTKRFSLSYWRAFFSCACVRSLRWIFNLKFFTRFHSELLLALALHSLRAKAFGCIHCKFYRTFARCRLFTIFSPCKLTYTLHKKFFGGVCFACLIFIRLKVFRWKNIQLHIELI